MPGDLGDHVQKDPPQAQGAVVVVLDGEVEVEGGGDRGATCCGAPELADRRGDGVLVGDGEAGVIAVGVTVPLVLGQCGDPPLEPAAFGRGDVVDQPQRCGQGGRSEEHTSELQS